MLARLAVRSNSALLAPLTNTSVRTYAQAPKKPTATTTRAAPKTSTWKTTSTTSKTAPAAAGTTSAASTSQTLSKAKETVKSAAAAAAASAKTAASPSTTATATRTTRTTTSQASSSTARRAATAATTAGVTQAPKVTVTTPKPTVPAPPSASTPQQTSTEIPSTPKPIETPIAAKVVPPKSPKASPTPEISEKPSAAKPAPDPVSEVPPTPESSEKPNATKPLPDLRQGIPSTFAEEFSKASKSYSASAPPPEPGPQNITEDGSDEPQAAGASGSGGSRSGELPRSAYETSGDRFRNRLANWSYLAIAAFGVTGTVYLGRNWDTEAEELAHKDAPSGWGVELMYERAKARLNSQMGYYTEPNFPKLLPELDAAIKPPYTLVLSLEDLLVHSEWSRENGWRTAKRPGVDYFIRYLSQYYELVIFTSLPYQAADQICRKLDPYHIIMWQLFREATRYDKGEYIKDLTYLNRPLDKTLMIDTVASHAKNQPENAIIIPKWTGERNDKGLVSLIPFLEYLASMKVADVRSVIKSFEGKSIPEEFSRREAIARKQHEERIGEGKKRGKRSAPGTLLGAMGIKPVPGQQGMMMMEGGLGAVDGDKFVGDVIRERGTKTYEALERQIREEGEKWLAEEKEFEKKQIEEQMKSSKKWMGSLFVAEGSEEQRKEA